MIDIDKYLTECVYYPCSGLHGLPIKFLGHYFKRFFYVDYHISREEFDEAIREGLKGYQLCETEELTPEMVFGLSWDSMRKKHASAFEKVDFEWNNPFVVRYQFERMGDFDDDHGPVSFELLFARCEAVTAYIEAFSRRSISPECLVHIRSGIGFGGNYSKYPQRLESAIGENKAGIPPLMMFDRMGSNKNSGDYLPLIDKYDDLVEIWGYPDGGRLTLARVNPDCSAD